MLQLIDVPCDKGYGHMRLYSLCKAIQMDCENCDGLQTRVSSIYQSSDAHVITVIFNQPCYLIDC